MCNCAGSTRRAQVEQQNRLVKRPNAVAERLAAGGPGKPGYVWNGPQAAAKPKA